MYQSPYGPCPVGICPCIIHLLSYQDQELPPLLACALQGGATSHRYPMVLPIQVAAVSGRKQRCRPLESSLDSYIVPGVLPLPRLF